MIETILQGPPNVLIRPLDQIPIQFEITTEELALSLTEPVTPGDINALQQDNTNAFAKGKVVVVLADQFENYYNAYNTANTYIATATATPLLMMRSLINVLTLPSKFAIDVKTRIGVLADTFDLLRANLFGLIGVSSKQLFQNEAGATIAALCVAASTPLPNNYRNASPILEVIDELVRIRGQYIEDLDYLQTANDGSPDSFVANPKPIIELNNLVNLTISALFELSLSARSERSITVSKDTNWVLLAHQLYGLNASDSNLNDLIDQNSDPVKFPEENFLNELLQVQKDRKVVYYV